MNHTTTVTAGSLEVPDARLHYEVRGQGPLVVLVGAPMDAASFAPLADLLAADHTVLTTDPRGINRSPLDDPDQDSTPELRADDLSRLLTHLDAGPAAVFGSSGGAVSALALAQAHPELVHTVIAHEPPLDELLDDRERAATPRPRTSSPPTSPATSSGAWAQVPGPRPTSTMPERGVRSTMFGGRARPAGRSRTSASGSRTSCAPTTRWRPDIAALRAGPTRIVVGIGEESAGQLCDRTSSALAAALGIEPTMFPGGHIGFADDPEGFVTRLRAVLRGN